MADEKRFMFALSIGEAAVIKLLRETHMFGEITITKANNEIRRVNTKQTYLIEDILKKYGLEEKSDTIRNTLANGHVFRNTEE